MKRLKIVAAAWCAASAALVVVGWNLRRIEDWQYRRALRRLDVHGYPVDLPGFG